MRASELRIGNLVEHPELGTSRVCVIQDNCYGVSNKKTDDSRISYLKCKPIPLTEEWLLRFGFVKNETYSFKNISSGLELLNISDKYFRGFFRDAAIKADIQHLHQLQNLYFALTNQELTLKNK